MHNPSTKQLNAIQLSTNQLSAKQLSTNQLNTNQRIISAIVGIVFWFIFLVIIRNTPWLFDGSTRNLITFVVTIPLTWLIVLGVKNTLGFNNKTIFEVVVIATFTAMLFDGTVFTFFPDLYGSTEIHVRRGAGYILWAAAWGMIMSWLMYLRSENDAL